jgi:hypothetical protein
MQPAGFIDDWKTLVLGIILAFVVGFRMGQVWGWLFQ